MGIRRRGEKRDRSLSSVHSSPLPPSKVIKIMSNGEEPWPPGGAYNVIYLTLLRETMNGQLILPGVVNRVTFWNSFTRVLNRRIRESGLCPDTFRGFSPVQVTEYGKVLKATYHEHKGRSDFEEVFTHFALFKEVFEEEKKYPSFPSANAMLGIKRSSSTRTGSSSKRSTYMDLDPDMGTIDPAATVLSSLLNEGKISVQELYAVEDRFKKYNSSRLTWLQMNPQVQIDYIRGLPQQGNQVNNQNNQSESDPSGSSSIWW